MSPFLPKQQIIGVLKRAYPIVAQRAQEDGPDSEARRVMDDISNLIRKLEVSS